MFMLACTVAYPEAVAVIVVAPGVNVEWNLPDAYVAPASTVTVGSTVPISVRDDEMLIVVSA